MSESGSLREIVNITSQIENMLMEANGEITPQIELFLIVKDTHLPEKIDNYDLFLERMDSVEEFYSNLADKYSRLANSASKLKDKLKDNLLSAMKTLDVNELSGNTTRFVLAKSNPSVIIENEELVDAAYIVIKTTKSFDKKRIGEDLKSGIPIPGAKLQESFSLRKYDNTPKQKG